MSSGKKNTVDIEPTIVEAEHWIALSPTAKGKPIYSPIATRTRNSPFVKRTRSSRSKSVLSDSDDGSARPVSPTDNKFTHAFEEEAYARTKSTRAHVPHSPHVLPFAHATLSPMSKGQMKRKLDRLAKQEKVAIAFDMEDFSDAKSCAGKEIGAGQRILSMPLAELSDGEEKRLTSLGTFLFKMCCLVVAFLVSGSLLFASKNYSEANGIMRVMANQDALKSEVRQYARSHLNWAVDGAARFTKYFSSGSSAGGDSGSGTAQGSQAPIQMGQYAVFTNDVYSVDTSLPPAVAKKTVVAYSASTKPPVGPKFVLPARKHTSWRRTGVHAPLNPAFKIVTLRDPQQEALDAEIQAGVARVSVLVESMRTDMERRAKNMLPLQCKLTSATMEDVVSGAIPSCNSVKLLLDPIQSLVDTSKIEIVDSSVEAPTVQVQQRIHGPPLTVRLLDVERVGLLVEVPLGEAAGMMHFDESGLRLTKVEVNAE